ncbi:uncharacterized protein [Euphorbia lathyris]|uniref:uncharacterized protein isoform X2 n=1 Tax=Euphorbia lathyris TaxID=212925 RepID=UPI0033144B59
MAMTLIQQQPFFSFVADCNEALGHSITFGRFISDSYSFASASASASDKWSTSSHVEEAQRLCRPGSVAQKRALFEAHTAAPKTDDPQVGAQGSDCTVDVTSLTAVEEEIVAAVEEIVAAVEEEDIVAAVEEEDIAAVEEEEIVAEEEGIVAVEEDIVVIEEEIVAAFEEEEIVAAVEEEDIVTIEDEEIVAAVQEEEEIVVVECSSQILKEQPISKKPPKSMNFRKIKRIIRKIDNFRAQLQTTLKGKAEAELKKLSQSLCFKARPPPYVLQTNQMEKVPNMVQATAQPPQRSSFKNGGSKHATRKNNENTQLQSKYSK